MKKLISIFGLVLFLCGSALANVSLKNGNFFIGYKDIVYPGGFEPRVERVYNSKTPYKGIFGWGWGTEYEVYLTVSADGSVIVHEFGGGAENRFIPVGFSKEELSKAADLIVQQARAAGIVSNPKAIQDYRNKLLSDATFRNDEWEKFKAQGKVQARQLKSGTQLYSSRFNYQYITKVIDGYVRTFDNGRIEKFSDSGKLVQIADRNGNFIKFSYGKEGHLASLVDNFNRKIFFEFNNQGLIEKITGESKKVAEYKYNNLSELVQSKDVDGNIYQYDYSSDKRHNLTKIKYSDNTSMDIEYYGRDKFENVKRIKDRDGSVSEYGYDYAGLDQGNYKVSTVLRDKSGNKISSTSYEYYGKTKATGEQWTYRMIAVVDGERTETEYNECCGLPVMIKKGDRTTLFDYDKKGRLIKKETPVELSVLQYHPEVGKVTRVEKTNKNRKQKEWSEFEYDKKGNLLFAKNSDKKTVRLFYDSNGRIKSMVDQNKRQIAFKYNENSKPIEISDPKLGTIKVSYSNSGEIKNVESSAGRKIALEVTSAFQNLLEIIRPAGVNLSL